MVNKSYDFTKKDTRNAKAFAILLMLIHHLFAFPDRISNVSYISLFSFRNKPIEYQAGVLSKICVAMFLVLSGYGMYLSSKDKDTTHYILRKIKSLYLVFWKIFIVFVPIGLILKPQEFKRSFLHFILNFTAVKVTYNYEWWFIAPFIAIMLIFPLLLRWLNRKNSSFFIDLVSIITLSVFISDFLPIIIKNNLFSLFMKSMYWQILNPALYLLPDFIMGMFIAKYNIFEKIRRIDFLQNNIVMFIFSFLCIFTTFYMRYKTGARWDYIFAPILIIAFTSLVNCLPSKLAMLQKLGAVATEIWLLHSFYCYKLTQSFIFGARYSILIYLLLLAVSYLSAIGINFVFNHIGALFTRLKLTEKSTPTM